MKRLLFVCMGNICRSPVVEVVARTRLNRARFEVETRSAGTEGYHVGESADRRAVKTALGHGYDLSQHRARRIATADFLHYDAVLAMDRVNLRALAAMCPADAAHKLALFLAFAGVATLEEVPDPYYGNAQDFERVIELAEAGVDGLIDRLAKSA